MSRRTIKKLLLSLIAVGVIGSVTARSTYALLNSKDEHYYNALIDRIGIRDELASIRQMSEGLYVPAPDPKRKRPEGT